MKRVSYRSTTSLRWRTLPFYLALVVASHAAPITIGNTQDLSFGALVAGPAGGAVTVSTDGARTCAAGITCLPQSTAFAAEYSISGDPLTAFVITLTASAMLSDGASNTMTVDTFVDSLGGSGTFDVTGASAFSVGATLHAGSAQPSGAYTGSFDVLVEYQ